jgi:predicted ribosome quality control (RQC) complex YloA/Tae2 family protein
MSLTRRELADALAELHAGLVGAYLNKLNAPAPNQLQLIFKGLNLLIDLGPAVRRLHEIEQKLQAPPKPPEWVMKCRAEIQGRRLSGLSQPNGDRVVIFEFAGWPDRCLVLEFFGQGKLLLLDERGRIMSALLGKADPGSVYTPPEFANPPAESSRFGAPDPAKRPVNSAIERLYAQQSLESNFQALKKGLARRLSTAERRLKRRVTKIEADLERTRVADGLAAQAEALKYQLGAVRRGQIRVQLPNPFDPEGASIQVELDPSLNPQQNMKRMFARSRRLTAARGSIAQRLGEARDQLTALRVLSAQVMMADSALALEELGPQIKKIGPAKLAGRSAKSTRANKRRQPYRLFHSANGTTILVGRSGRDNHELTFRVANGQDLWLHARDAAAAHVVVRLERGRDIDEPSLLDAATLAALHSPLKASGKVEVTYTRVKNVHPIKGAPPGLVSVAKGKTLLIRMEPERIKRIKDSKIK